nr:discoidin domain-containing protein [Luteimonas aquatica]
MLDGFDDATAWRVVTSNQVSGALRRVDGPDGAALCLDYDFNGVSGYAGIQRDLAIDYPDNYAFAFRLRGDSPANDLQMKFVDASGDNVWWVNRPKYAFPEQWTQVRYKKRHIDKAWGPDPDRTLRRSAKLEFTLYNSVGGKGSVCFDSLTFEALPKQDDSPLRATATATASQDEAANAVDGKAATAWNPVLEGEPSLTLDLGSVREFGGVVLEWASGTFVPGYRIAISDDGMHWSEVRKVRFSDGGRDDIALPESEARYLRLTLEAAGGQRAALADIALQPLAYAATPNDFVKSVAAHVPRGRYPRGFSGEQPYWTIVGLDGGTEQGLVGEDGAIELGKGGLSIEPFVLDGGKLVTWNDVQVTQSLRDGYLPIPRVTWKHAGFTLETTAFAQGDPARSQLVGRYAIANTSPKPRKLALALVARPLQVNPPTQFLSTTGGVSAISTLHAGERTMEIDGKIRASALQPADAHFSQAFDEGSAVERLAGEYPRASSAVRDPTGLASGAWVYEMELAPGERREFAWVAPMTGALPDLAGFDPARAEAAVAAQWRDKLDRVRIAVPAQGQALADTLRTATAHMLISRIGPRLQPGTRSYARSWIRDGAMISEGLLRMGREEVVREYVDWYAPYQFKDGMVPCCVDARGSDPVPENDSHGELIFNIAELYRYDGDKAFLRRMWPHVTGAFAYMEKLRLSERTEENRARDPAFYGMMPASISHEGYSAKPMHSYWDNFWALRGYKDAVQIAQWLGEDAAARRFAASRDQFRDDLYASLRAATRRHGIDYLPGAAELGDFDPTSTTIALAPGGEQGRLPAELLHNGFERYWREFVQRREGKREWKDYTPYEWRNVAAFVRLGWRERAWEATEFFFGDRAPQPWNQWAEVVSRTPRKPFFVGDLPHAWVASDFVRSALDMFAYSREIDDSIVLAAGLPAGWFEGEGVSIRGLRTPQGALGYTLRADARALTLQVPAGLRLPAGGLVLPWPYAGEPGQARINGKPASWRAGELRIQALPATVEIARE